MRSSKLRPAAGFRRILSVCGLLGMLSLPGLAHPLAPALLKLEEGDGQRYTVTWRPPAGRPGAAALRPLLPGSCPEVGERRRRRAGGDFEQAWEIRCAPAGLIGEELSVLGLREARTEVLLTVLWQDGRRASAVLRPEEASWEVPQRPGALTVLWDYLRYGVEHILVGLDHLCFVLALVLLVPRPKRLFWTLTGFTLGHSLTLALATLGILQLPSIWTEAAIAGSILVAAVELTRDGPTFLRRFSVLGASAFGLLHGLGFAGVLAEVGLPAGEVPLSLFAFNLGIEVGQILFVLGVWILLAARRRALPELPSWTRSIPVYLIGSLAAYWLIDRAAQGLGI